MRQTINDFFAYANEDGTVTAYNNNDMPNSSNKIYILNNYGKKIVQLIINEETNNQNEKFAQIKVIPYDIKKVLDTSSITQKFKRFYNAELTYHGSSDADKTSKIHLKYLEDKKYHTIVDNSCEISEKGNQLIPLFSINTGNLYNDKQRDDLKSKTVKYTLTSQKSPVVLDFYIAEKEFDFEKYMNSIYSFSMFYSMNYLDTNKNFPLYQSLIMQPIESFNIKGYKVFIRATLGKDTNSPYFVFYNNVNFYNNFLNRGMMYANEDGSVSDTINVRDREKELSQGNVL